MKQFLGFKFSERLVPFQLKMIMKVSFTPLFVQAKSTMYYLFLPPLALFKATVLEPMVAGV